jgi:hypothetical protein
MKLTNPSRSFLGAPDLAFCPVEVILLGVVTSLLLPVL